ncbi:hypothetical protein [Leptospira sp. GIMC2001]|uniref:hypothetical protein n=1 Tax=Leptospira sp. GIMC2001 TaxID=1513297 RepID=UPI0023491F68|nr:hypothetical protein [Leptospira sp. GIMC2001]WCL49534.1 hypothetical protein O4O04_01585 [Leptospira sp. GIMC2001]
MKSLIIISYFLLLTINISIFGQTKALITPTSDSKTGTEAKSDHSETKALKYEEGDVTIDLKIESERLIKLSDKKLKVLNPILLNRKKEATILELQKQFLLAKTAFSKGEYKDSRRLSKEGLDNIETESVNLSKQYEEKYNSYSNELNEKIAQLKNQSETYPISNPNLIAYLNKRIQESGFHFRKAEFLNKSGQNLDSIKFYQLSILELLNGIQKANIEIQTSSREKKENDDNHVKILKIDYLPIEARKDYDDSRNLNHEVQEQKRTKERERIQSLKGSKQSTSVESKESKESEEKTQPKDSN